MSDELAHRVASGSRVVAIGYRTAEAADVLRHLGCDVTTVAHPDRAAEAGRFDVALVGEFREDWPHPSDVLVGLRHALDDRGRALVSRAGAGPVAVRVTVYGESAGETVSPLVRDLELDRYATLALGELLATAGYRVVAGTPGDAWIEAFASDVEPLATVRAVRTESETTGIASELRDVRAFAQKLLERQRRLHEELARLRSALAGRDESLAALRRQLDESFGSTALAKERAERLEIAERSLFEAEGRIADLEARRIRLTETVIALREG